MMFSPRFDPSQSAYLQQKRGGMHTADSSELSLFVDRAPPAIWWRYHQASLYLKEPRSDHLATRSIG